MKKIHCLNPISSYGTKLFTEDYTLTEDIQEAHGVLVRSASMHEMDFPGGLLAIARAGAGVNNIPLDACSAEGIVVFNTPGANANGVKELVIAGLMMASRDIRPPSDSDGKSEPQPPALPSATNQSGDGPPRPGSGWLGGR